MEVSIGYNLVGSVAENEKHAIGIITSCNIDLKNDSYLFCKGIDLDGKFWSSKNPHLLARNVREYISKVQDNSFENQYSAAI
jgi:hypothetical protein